MLTSRTKIIFCILTLLIVSVFGLKTQAQTNTVIPNPVWGNVEPSAIQNVLGLGAQDPRITAAKMIRALLGFLGIIAVVLILYAGFTWMMSGGNEEKISRAKAILKNAAIGLIIILASFGIVSFILNQIIGSIGGNGGGGGGGGSGGGVSGLGNGIIQSVYPAPFQRDVPRNTVIMVTFREAIKADTICEDVTSTGDCAVGTKILPDSVRIFRTGTTTYVTDVFASSTDNKTFIFRPASLLGDQNGEVDYSVNLTTDIKKANGSSAFSLSTGFLWTFQVSNDVDLVSPQIVSVNRGGIFPLPDDDADTISGTTVATAAQGTIVVASQPSAYHAATTNITRLTPPSISTTNATVTGTNRCQNGTITAAIIDVSGTLKARVSYTQSGLQPADLTIINNHFEITPCQLTVNLDSGFATGHSWRISVTGEVRADTVTIGSKIYTFVNGTATDNQITLGTSPTTTAAAIKDAVNSIHPQVTATASGTTVTLQAKVAGLAGNRLELSTSNPVALTLSGFSGGADATTTYTINDLRDQPKNTIIQINFNEAINPVTVSGSSTDLASIVRVVNAAAGAQSDGQSCSQDQDCKSYRCNSGICQDNQLRGTFTVSNQYKTVEFISDNKCGINGCGENIYCLPANSQLKVEIEAASLLTCTSNADCQMSPYNTCVSGTCQDSQSHNYPGAASINGIVDAANNSLDGNRNVNPQGKIDTWNENLPAADNGDRGDNYVWSFWISDRLDLSTPTIMSTSVNNNQGNVGLATSIEVLFSKLMSATSLSSGSVTVNNGLTSVNHHLINLWSRAGDAIGYWIHKEDRDLGPIDGQPDQTAAIIGHGIFNDSTDYRAQVGSGVKDIYQNCYKPSSGPNCTADPLNPSCCRNSIGDLQPTATLTAQGNCP